MIRKVQTTVLALILALLCLCNPFLPTAQADDGADRGATAAAELYELGLFRGTSVDADGNPVFELERQATRNEAVTTLVRLLGKEAEATTSSWTTPFTDVADWAAPYVGYAYANGLTNGTSDTTYGGEAEITATQYITYVLRALGYDSSSDFAWDSAYLFSDSIGLTHGEYDAEEEPFTRGDMAEISFDALFLDIKGTTIRLLDTIFVEDGNQTQDTAAPTSYFEVHFIDVGQADAALVLCDGAAMLIDGGNVADSSLIYSYLQNHGVTHLNYIVSTHPHEDHVGGLAGALNFATVDVALSPVLEYDTKAFGNFVKYLNAQRVSLTIPFAGDTFSLGSASVQVLGPVRQSTDMNDMSIVLRVVYGNTSFLFTGDAGREEEHDILEAGYTLGSTVLKVGHHGSESSTSYVFLREVMPQAAVISVGSDNPYGHPTDAVLSRLRDADVKVYRTDMQGTVICRSDGSTVSFEVSRNADADTLASVEPNSLTRTDEPAPLPTPEPAPTPRQIPVPTPVPSPTPVPAAVQSPASPVATYILNTSTRKFHYPSCSSVSQMSEKNKETFTGTREEAIEMGYSPCGRCKP